MYFNGMFVHQFQMRYTGFMEKKTLQQINRPTLKDQVYEALKNAIINLELEPGQRLNDNKLAEQFAVSRTPVREALKRLEDEGLVEAFPGSSTRVTDLNEKEARHAFTVVAALHALATKLAVPLMENPELQRLAASNENLAKALEQNNSAKAINADTGFHAIFLEIAGNGEIDKALERILPKIHRLTLMKFKSIDSHNSIQQHEEIIAACKRGDAEIAAHLVEENWLTLGKLLTRTEKQ